MRSNAPAENRDLCWAQATSPRHLTDALGPHEAFYPGLGHDPVHGNVMGLRANGGDPGRHKTDADHQGPCGKGGQRAVKIAVAAMAKAEGRLIPAHQRRKQDVRRDLWTGIFQTPCSISQSVVQGRNTSGVARATTTGRATRAPAEINRSIQWRRFNSALMGHHAEMVSPATGPLLAGQQSVQTLGHGHGHGL
jgi:hypothetical protein